MVFQQQWEFFRTQLQQPFSNSGVPLSNSTYEIFDHVGRLFMWSSGSLRFKAVLDPSVATNDVVGVGKSIVTREGVYQTPVETYPIPNNTTLISSTSQWNVIDFEWKIDSTVGVILNLDETAGVDLEIGDWESFAPYLPLPYFPVTGGMQMQWFRAGEDYQVYNMMPLPHPNRWPSRLFLDYYEP